MCCCVHGLHWGSWHLSLPKVTILYTRKRQMVNNSKNPAIIWNSRFNSANMVENTKMHLQNQVQKQPVPAACFDESKMWSGSFTMISRNLSTGRRQQQNEWTALPRLWCNRNSQKQDQPWKVLQVGSRNLRRRDRRKNRGHWPRWRENRTFSDL